MDPHTRANRLRPLGASMGVDNLRLAADGGERPVASQLQFHLVVSPGGRAARPDGTGGVTAVSSTP